MNIPRYLSNFDTDKLEKSFYDVIIVGSGIAGLSAALKACGIFKTLLITKGDVKETTTWYAQGGVAGAISEKDSPALHFKDTVEAGDGLCDKKAVKVLVSEGPLRIKELVEMGADFDRIEGEISLTREGGHSIARIIHSGDATGSEIEKVLMRKVKMCAGLEVKERVFAVDILTHNSKCVGVLAFDLATQSFKAFFGSAVILASGGAGQVYEVTTNPQIVTGDGIAMAYRAGAELADMEFFQFHPTALDEERSPRFLITEAIRGEGAYLRDCLGKRFMVKAHPLAELAPRDVVVREMIKAMERCQTDHVFLDATHLPEEKLKSHFPTIWQRCRESGFNLARDLIPVSPAAHFFIGGVKTDLNGKTNLEGLFACGEVAATFVHGANRLASNSLLEGLVFSKRIMDFLLENLDSNREALEKIRISSEVKMKSGFFDFKEKKEILQKTMTQKVGVVRSEKSLKEAIEVINSLAEVFDFEANTVETFEFKNLLIVAKLITEAALKRKESRGVHFREDFPKQRKAWRKHFIFKKK